MSKQNKRVIQGTHQYTKCEEDSSLVNNGASLAEKATIVLKDMIHVRHIVECLSFYLFGAEAQESCDTEPSNLDDCMDYCRIVSAEMIATLSDIATRVGCMDLKKES